LGNSKGYSLFLVLQELLQMGRMGELAYWTFQTPAPWQAWIR